MPVGPEKVNLLYLILIPYLTFHVVASEIDSPRPTAKHPEACDALLESDIWPELKRIQITPDLFGKANGEDRVLLEAITGILKICDDRLLTRVSQAIIESPATA